MMMDAMVVRQTFIVAPQDGALFANSAQVQALVGLSVSQSLMQHAAPSQQASCGATSGQAGLATFCQSGGWVQTTGNDWSANGAYKSRGGGVLAGFDHVLGAGRIGLTAGYDSSDFKDDEQSKARLQAVRLGVYGDLPLGPLTLSAAVMDGLTTTRTTRITGVGAALADGHGNVLTTALQAGSALTWGTTLISPTMGAMLVRAQNGAVSETSSDSPMSVRTQAAARTSLVPYLHLMISKDFITIQGVKIDPVVQAGLVLNSRNFAADTVMFAQDETAFTAAPQKLSRLSVPLGAGMVMSRGNWRLMFGYNATIAGNWHEQAIQGTLLVRF